MRGIKLGLASQNKDYLKKLLKAMNEVDPSERNSFYEIYKTELTERINKLK